MIERKTQRLCSLRFSLKKLFFVWGLVLAASVTVLGQQRNENPRIDFPERIVREAQDSLKIPFKIRGASNKRVRVRVESDVDVMVSKEISLSSKGEHVLLVNLFEGENRISFIVFVNDEPQIVWDDSVKVFCSGRWCKKPFSMSADLIAEELDTLEEGRTLETKQAKGGKAKEEEAKEGAKEGTKEGEAKNKSGKQQGSIEILEPKKTDVVYQDATVIPLKVKVEKREKGDQKDEPKQIEKVYVRVLNEGKPIEQEDEYLQVEFPDGEKSVVLTPMVRIGKKMNSITVFDAANSIDDADQDSRDVTCEGEKCGSDPAVSTIPTNSQNTRGVVGFEQAGASSAGSETKPFLDFYFSTPFIFTRRTAQEIAAKIAPVPRVAAWGNIRFSTTPVQTATAAAFPSNLVNQATDPSGKVVDLVQSFDFLAGLEARIFSANGSFLSLIPGIRQKTRFYFAVGGGAISPLSARREATQIFRIPDANDPQRDLFEQRFGVPPEGKTFIGFVPLERDRFFRQFYAGLRLKTFYCEEADEGCLRPLNNFPAIVDFMFGQNEAVTGGQLKYDVRDAANNIIGRKRSYVIRIDGFYPFPIKAANFLYLYGSAMMKVGAGGVKITNPLFLDTAPGDVLITTPSVFIPPAEKQPSQLDRDFYKIGIGVNLTDLFNRNKQPPN